MVKEYYNFIKEYLKLAQTKFIYLFFSILTAFMYKGFLIVIPIFASWIIKYATISDFSMTINSLILLSASYLLYQISYYINCKIYGINMSYCYNKLQTRLFNKVLSTDDKFTKVVSKGKLINSINGDVIDIGDMMDQVSELLVSIIQILVICIILAKQNIFIATFIFLTCYMYLLLKNYQDRKSNIYLVKQKNCVDEYSNLFSQILSGLQEIKTFDMLPKLKKKLNIIERKYSKNYLLKRKYITRKEIDTRFIVVTSKIILYVFSVILLANGKLDISILVLIISYQDSLITYIDDLISTTSKIREVNVSVKRVNKILNYKSSEKIDFGFEDNDNIKGIIEFKNVNFGYESKQIIKDLSFKVKPNMITAIVGQSGTGKTSIINLLLRLYKIDSGEILIDGINIYKYTKDIYKSNVAVVNQKPFIFNMSIRKNLDFVDTNVENQIEACKRVGIHDFIESLPNGYNTILKEDAKNISGGQKQLISLARTLLTKSEILLFDEITSSLDPNTAKHIANLLKDLKKDHTILMITHKPELMKKADRLIVLHEGKIVGDGKHKELIGNNKYYDFLQLRKSASRIGVFNNDN